MVADELRLALRSVPFGPFTIHLVDGRKFRVEHPELMLVSPGGRTAVLASGRDSFEHIDVLMITSISKGEVSGRNRRRKAG